MEEKEKQLRTAVHKALDILGIRNLVFGIHDGAFPSRPDEDTGRGSPYSNGAADFLRLIASLGFTGIQLGPQGMTTPANPSPYDGTLFSRNPLSLSLSRLREQIDPSLVENIAPAGRAESPVAGRVQPHHALQVVQRIVGTLNEAFSLTDDPRQLLDAGRPAFSFTYDEFHQRNSNWLKRDGLYEILRRLHGGRNWRFWDQDGSAGVDRFLFAPPAGRESAAAERMHDLLRRHGRDMTVYSFIQYLLHEQHLAFRERMHHQGMILFGDLQIGLSGRDAWSAGSFLLPGYLMGAPPSRTNPAGQPWNYPVLDPSKYHDEADRHLPGPALQFVQERMAKLCREYDGLRIDHPHGLVCPWVYRSGQPDPHLAVQNGARLFASPNLADHPELARYAIPRPDQLDTSKPRYDDHWVTRLEEKQVGRYASLFEVIMRCAADNGRGIHEIACEILSTQPYPIKLVMDRYGLGRFRITQKADLDNPADVYRGENAAPEDWIMLGNHDTPSIWQKSDEWCAGRQAGQQAAYLAGRLNIQPDKREEWISKTAAEPGALALAKCADLFVGPARNVMIFFTDLLGFREQYNRPGSTGEENWSLRIRPDCRRRYPARAARKEALDIPGALALALRTREENPRTAHEELIRYLENWAASHQ